MDNNFGYALGAGSGTGGLFQRSGGNTSAPTTTTNMGNATLSSNSFNRKYSSGFNNTYNQRYPGFDEANYKKLESKIDALGLTGADKVSAMDDLYKQVLPMVQNQNQMAERGEMLNQNAYEISNMQDPTQKAQSQTIQKVNEISQNLKKQFNIPATASDEEVFNAWIDSIPNGEELFANYINYNDDTILKKGGLSRVSSSEAINKLNIGASRATGGRFGLINSQVDNGGLLPNITEIINPIGYATEILDNVGNEVADKITFTGEGNIRDLADRVNNLSEKQLDEYRKIYNQMTANKDIRTQIVHGGTIVEQLWDGLTDWWNGTQEYGGDEENFRKRVVQQEATLWESMTGADDTLNGVNSPNVVKFFANMPSSGIRTLTATIRGRTNPIDTLTGLYKLIGTSEGRQALMDKYGSWDAIADLMNYDPVGTADDILALVDGVKDLGGNVSKFSGIVSGKQNRIDAGNKLINNNIGSVFDGVADVGVPKLYKGMDNLKSDGNSKMANAWNKTLDYSKMASNQSKLRESAWNTKAGQFVSQKMKDAMLWSADKFLQNKNRINATQQLKFKEMVGQDQGTWMNERNLKDGADLANYFLESKQKVDDAMGKIEGRFTDDSLTKVLDEALDRAVNTENKQNIDLLTNLKNKNDDGGLTMSEINQVKRIYEKENKFSYYKDNNSEKLDRATNRDTALREWQMKTAEENGLTNLKELNKETQASKFLTDKIGEREAKTQGNNPIGLTDWIAFAGNGVTAKSLSALVGKKVFESKWFQKGLVNVLNYFGDRKQFNTPQVDYKLIDEKNGQKQLAQAIMLEELAKVKSEEEFNRWLEQAKVIMETPALPYKGDVGDTKTFIRDDGKPTTVGPDGTVRRQGQIAEGQVQNINYIRQQLKDAGVSDAKINEIVKEIELSNAKESPLFGEGEVQGGKMQDGINPDKLTVSDYRKMQEFDKNMIRSTLSRNDKEGYIESKVLDDLGYDMFSKSTRDMDNYVAREGEVKEMIDLYNKGDIANADDIANGLFKGRTAKSIIDEYTNKYNQDLKDYNNLVSKYEGYDRGKVSLGEKENKPVETKPVENKPTETKVETKEPVKTENSKFTPTKKVSDLKDYSDVKDLLEHHRTFNGEDIYVGEINGKAVQISKSTRDGETWYSLSEGGKIEKGGDGIYRKMGLSDSMTSSKDFQTIIDELNGKKITKSTVTIVDKNGNDVMKMPDKENTKMVQTKQGEFEVLPDNVSVYAERSKNGPKRIAPDRVWHQQLTPEEAKTKWRERQYKEATNRVNQYNKVLDTLEPLYEKFGNKLEGTNRSPEATQARKEIRKILDAYGLNSYYSAGNIGDIKRTFETWKGMYENQAKRKTNDDLSPKDIQNFKKEYISSVKSDISKGYRYPEEVLKYNPEFQTAIDSRDRYEKGLYTSFSTDDTRIVDYKRDQIGAGMKRQDGKELTQAQKDEIVEGVNLMQSSLGLDMKKMAEENNRVYVHLNGKNPFLTNNKAGGKIEGYYRETSNSKGVTTASISIGGSETFVKRVDGKNKTIRTDTTMPHELTHALDHKMDGRLVDSDTKVKLKYNINDIDKYPTFKEYWRDSAEITARMVEEYILAKEGDTDIFKKPGYWNKSTYEELIKPAVEKAINTKLKDYKK